MTPEPAGRRLRREFLVIAVAWVGAFLLALAWIIATPVGGGPDENAHMIKAAGVVRGQLIGEPTKDADLRAFTLPPSLAHIAFAPNCFAFRGDVAADCQTAWSSDLGGTPTQATTWVGTYNPLYYLIVGLPSLVKGGIAAALLMRVVSAVLTTFFVAVAFWATRFVRAPLIAGVAVAASLTPMAVFMASQVNPNGIEIAAMLALAVLVFGLVRSESQELLRTRLVLVALAGVFGVSARGLSPAFVLVIALIAFVLARPGAVAGLLRRPASIVSVAFIAVAGVFAAVWSLKAGVFGGLVPGPGVGDGPVRAFFVTLKSTPGYLRQMVGVFGWQDAPLPIWVAVVWGVVSAAIVAAALVVGDARARIAVVLAVLAFVFLPAIVQAKGAAATGYIWQGRYTLPLFGILLAVSGIVLGAQAHHRARSTVARTACWVVLGVTGLLQLVALTASMRRFEVGVLHPLTQMFTAPRWTPEIGVWGVYALFAIGGLVLFSVVVTSRPVGVESTRELHEKSTTAHV